MIAYYAKAFALLCLCNHPNDPAFQLFRHACGTIAGFPVERAWVGAAAALQSPTLWGPVIWTLLHTLAAKYEPRRRGMFEMCLHNLAAVLPCPTCAAHFNQIWQRRSTQLAWRRVRCQSQYQLFIRQLHSTVTADIERRVKV